MGLELELDAASAVSPAASGTGRQRRGWFRRTYSPVEAEAEQGTAAPPAEEEEGTKPRTSARRRWLRRLAAPREYARWTKLSGAPSRLAAGLRWKRAPSSVRGFGCASAVLDTVAFRVMYVVEAVVLGLALSCFFCCCGCQI